MVSTGSIPVGALILAFLVLVALKFVVSHTLEGPSAAEKPAKEDKNMSRSKLAFISVLDTIHGLGINVFAGCLPLLTKRSLPYKISQIQVSRF